MGSTRLASARPPTPQARSWAVATVLTACRSGRIGLDEAEERLDAVYAAATFAQLYTATAGLPDPPAPIVISR